MIRVRRSGKHLGMDAERLYEVVYNGIKPNIRLMVYQQKPTSLDELVRAAKVAEAHAPPDNEELAALIRDAAKASTKAQEKQAAQLKALGTKVDRVVAVGSGERYVGTEHDEVSEGGYEAAVEFDNSRTKAQPPRRQYAQTPQMRQRNNYVNNFANRPNNGEPRTYRSPQQSGQAPAGQRAPVNTQGGSPAHRAQPLNTSGGCRFCGWDHERGNCRAFGQECSKCHKIGHFGRVCRSGRQATA